MNSIFILWPPAYLKRNGSAVVGGTVIQQDQLEILKALPQDAIDTLPQEPGMVIVRNDYGHCWLRVNHSMTRTSTLKQVKYGRYRPAHFLRKALFKQSAEI